MKIELLMIAPRAKYTQNAGTCFRPTTRVIYYSVRFRNKFLFYDFYLHHFLLSTRNCPLKSMLTIQLFRISLISSHFTIHQTNCLHKTPSNQWHKDGTQTGRRKIFHFVITNSLHTQQVATMIREKTMRDICLNCLHQLKVTLEMRNGNSFAACLLRWCGM